MWRQFLGKQHGLSRGALLYSKSVSFIYHTYIPGWFGLLRESRKLNTGKCPAFRVVVCSIFTQLIYTHLPCIFYIQSIKTLHEVCVDYVVDVVLNVHVFHTRERQSFQQCMCSVAGTSNMCMVFKSEFTCLKKCFSKL